MSSSDSTMSSSNSNSLVGNNEESGSSELPSRRKVLISFYCLSILYAIPYGGISTLVPGFFIFGSHPGASEESIEQSESIVELIDPLLFAIWLVFLFFVPALLTLLGGPRNSFATMMFAWSAANGMLVGAYILSLRGPSKGVQGFALAFAVIMGIFAGLGYTASEVYLDYCAEWMAHIDLNQKQLTVEEAEVQHRVLASTYKNRFASQLYAIIEIGSIVFFLPLVAFGDSAVQGQLIAITVCLLSGAFGSLFLPNWQAPHMNHHTKESGSSSAAEPLNGDSEEKGRESSCLRRKFSQVVTSAMDCFRCLSAYNGLAALGIIPYFFTGAFADVYRYNILLGPSCGQAGIGTSKMTLVLLISTITQAMASFASPMLIGPGKFRFKEHVYPMAFGNFCGCLSTIIFIAAGGNDQVCGSFGLLASANVLASISFAINNSVGVAAVMTWYDGRLQHWTVAALTSRSVWTQLGQIIAPFVYTRKFGMLSNGIPCAALTLAVYGTGSICVILAHWLNTRQVRVHIEKRQTEIEQQDPEEQAPGMSSGALEVERIRLKMTTGFKQD